MWPTDFAARLDAWVNLRRHCETLPKDQCLLEVNQWWFLAPWSTYYLHWDDRSFWPDPWQLLQDNIYCDLARGLGIAYTLLMVERKDISDVILVERGNDNLVLVDGEKYTLNWQSDDILNIYPENVNTRRSITQDQILKRIG